MLVNNTPLETYEIDGVPILVKREDLCAPYPGPSFSKLRGVYAHIKARPEPVIGVLDTYHSKAGWAVSYVCKELGKQAINFWPEYKRDRDMAAQLNDPQYLRPQQQEAKKLGALLVSLDAGRSAILYHRAKKILAANTNNGPTYMMPNALKLPESVTENAREVVVTPTLPVTGALVISISSGTVAAGVIMGFRYVGVLERYQVFLHMGYSRSHDTVTHYIEEKSGGKFNYALVDEGYGYADAATKITAPFPSNPYYDLKAWKWLNGPGVARTLQAQFGNIVFWNIGA
jgi:hypothetical protein